MATAEIIMDGGGYMEEQYVDVLGVSTRQCRQHEVRTVKTVGYEGEAAAKSAADAVVRDIGVNVTYAREGAANFYSVTVRTDTASTWANAYVVTFDLAGGTLTAGTSTRTVRNGSTYGTMPTATKDGFTLDGWFTEAAGAGTEITAATTVSLSGPQTLYASWV
jgi:uncharacterized repeat protein (TIGR02543 family)